LNFAEVTERVRVPLGRPFCEIGVRQWDVPALREPPLQALPGEGGFVHRPAADAG
jgi:hypothetical protein